MKYKYLDHTADAKFQAYGNNLEEAFINAALATFDILYPPEKIQPKIEHKIEVSAEREESLLYDFLEQLLFLLDTEGFMLNAVKKLTITKKDNSFSLHAMISGDSYKNYEIGGNIKSVTYNDMFIKKEDDKVILQVVLDL